MSIIYQNGIGDTLGDSLSTCKPLYTSGSIWYVGTGGVDAATPAGQNREKPLATLTQAIANAADFDTIVLLSGYTATFAATLTITKILTFVGSGSSGGLPTVKLTPNLVTQLFSITTSLVQLRNIWIAPNLQASASPRVSVTGAYFRMNGCYFECGANDQNAGLTLAAGADAARVSNTTFISTAVATTAQPESGMKTTAALTSLELENVVFNGGQFGFANYRAFDASFAAITGLRATGISQLLGADVKIHAATSGYWNTQLAQGGSRLDW